MRRIGITLTALASSFVSVLVADEPKLVEPKAANADAPLPAGFPDATRPGTIAIKQYPAYRSAVASGRNTTMRSGDALFWSLFRHISLKGIEMTAPVINTYTTPGLVEKPGQTGDLSMEFLYERPDLGEPGAGVGRVQVVDHPPVTVVSLGIQGAMSDDRMREGLGRLREWLADHKNEWIEAGPPRRLGYHGPMTPAARRLWEVQIPIRKADAEPSS